MNKLNLVLATTLHTVPCELAGLLRHGLVTGIPITYSNSWNKKVNATSLLDVS